MPTRQLHTLYHTCHICEGSGTYTEYDDTKASMLAAHYMTVTKMNDKQAWQQAFDETNYTVACPTCNGTGTTLNEEGQEMYQFLVQHA